MKRRACWRMLNILLARTTRRTYSMRSMSWSKLSVAPWPTKQRAAGKAAAEAQKRLEQRQGQLRGAGNTAQKRGPDRPLHAAPSLEQIEQEAHAASQEFARLSAQREQVAQSIRRIG